MDDHLNPEPRAPRPPASRPPTRANRAAAAGRTGKRRHPALWSRRVAGVGASLAAVVLTAQMATGGTTTTAASATPKASAATTSTKSDSDSDADDTSAAVASTSTASRSSSQAVTTSRGS